MTSERMNQASVSVVQPPFAIQQSAPFLDGSPGAGVDLREEQIYLSVIAPCFNEAAGLIEFCRRVVGVCTALGKPFEILLVNDGSQDATWPTMLTLVNQYPEITAINLARNFGQENAIVAGMSLSRGDVILVLDADLQDPPELLPRMLELIEEGADVVYGQRRTRAGDTWFKRSSAWLFYRFMEQLSEIPIPQDTGFFRLLRRRVVKVLLQMPERNRYLRGLVSWSGFHQVAMVFDRDARMIGESHWPLRRMISLALDAITGFSYTPLRWSGWLSVLIMMLTMSMLAVAFCQWLIQGMCSPALVIVAIVCAMSACHLTAIFILGLYVGRIAEQVRGRPLYIIENISTGCRRSPSESR